MSLYLTIAAAKLMLVGPDVKGLLIVVFDQPELLESYFALQERSSAVASTLYSANAQLTRLKYFNVASFAANSP
jgi:hypothetical protein